MKPVNRVLSSCSALAGRLNRFLCEHPLLLSLLYGTLFLAFFDIRYGIYDDRMLLADIQAGYSVRYMSFLLGSALSFCYRHIAPGFPWYGSLLFLTHLASVTLFLEGLRRIARFRKVFFPLALVYLSFYGSFLVKLSWNSAAIMVGANSLFLFLVTVRDERRRAAFFLLPGLLFSLSYLTRTMALAAVAVFALPAVAAVFFRRTPDRLRRWAAFLVPVLAVVLLNAAAVRLCAGKNDLSFDRFNELRSRFHEFPVEYANFGNTALLQENRWSTNDYRMLTEWLFYDDAKFTPESMQAVLRYAPRPRLDVARLAAALHSLEETYAYHALLLLALVLLCYYLTKPSPLFPFYVLYVTGGALAMTLYFRFPAWIGHPLLLGTAAFLLGLGALYPARESQETLAGRRLGNSVIVCLLLLALVKNSIDLSVYAAPVAFSNFAPKPGRLVHYLNSRYPGRTFLSDPYLPVAVSPDPFRPVALTYRVVPGGWQIFSPRFYDTLHAGLGVSSARGMWEKMIDNDDALLICSYQPFLAMIYTYYRENFPEKRIAFCRIDRYRNADIFKIVTER